MGSIRRPAIAGTFYPADPDSLAESIDRYLDTARPSHAPSKAIVAPHAGHVYSGPIAGSIYATLRPIADRIRRVVMIGPCHRVFVRGFAVPTHSHWQTPLGDIALDRGAIDRLAGEPDVEIADEPHEPEHCLEVQLPFLQRLIPNFVLVPVLAGATDPGRVDAILSALWGGPETLVVISSDLSHYHSYTEAQQLDQDASHAIEKLEPREISDEQACGRIPIKGLIARARLLDLRATTLDLRNSGDTVGSRDRVVGYGAYAFEYARTARLPDEQRHLLSDLARRVVAKSVAAGGKRPTFRVGRLPPQLKAMRATFVTLKIDGQLRGCIGSTAPRHPLALDVAENAYRAAFSDPRFSGLTAAELGRLDFSVSILSVARPIECRSEQELVDRLNPDDDGLILVAGEKRALFLPQVWENIPDPRKFILHLKEKAGIPRNHWPAATTAYRFTTETFDTPKA